VSRTTSVSSAANVTLCIRSADKLVLVHKDQVVTLNEFEQVTDIAGVQESSLLRRFLAIDKGGWECTGTSRPLAPQVLCSLARVEYEGAGPRVAADFWGFDLLLDDCGQIEEAVKRCGLDVGANTLRPECCNDVGKGAHHCIGATHCTKLVEDPKLDDVNGGLTAGVGLAGKVQVPRGEDVVFCFYRWV
jgi:hypothetical protein